MTPRRAGRGRSTRSTTAAPPVVAAPIIPFVTATDPSKTPVAGTQFTADPASHAATPVVATPSFTG